MCAPTLSAPRTPEDTSKCRVSSSGALGCRWASRLVQRTLPGPLVVPGVEPVVPGAGDVVRKREWDTEDEKTDGTYAGGSGQ